MTRPIQKDFVSLVAYLDNYRLEHITQVSDHLEIVRSGHRDYLPFLQAWAICLHSAENSEFSFLNHQINVDDSLFLFLRETVSDIGSGFFCCLHGAYKPGYMALRSSIENFLRFIVSVFDSEAAKTTVVQQLFNSAKNTPAFTDSREVYWQTLRLQYTQLNQYTHSSSLAHMTGLHALEHFPSFDEKSFNDWIAMARLCMRAMFSTLLSGFPKMYLDSHYVAKELLDNLLSRDQRLALLRGDFAK